MARYTIVKTMFAVVVVLSLTAALHADTKLVISHSYGGIGIGLGVGIGSPVPAPRYHPPVPYYGPVCGPWRHHGVHMGPPRIEPVVVHPPVLYPVVRPVVVQPATVVIRPAVPVVEEIAITVWITNSNGSQTTVRLTRQGAWYVGPRGEYYAEMPTNEQLRVVYGF